jgi:hypothetical protein
MSTGSKQIDLSIDQQPSFPLQEWLLKGDLKNSDKTFDATTSTVGSSASSVIKTVYFFGRIQEQPFQRQERPFHPSTS